MRSLLVVLVAAVLFAPFALAEEDGVDVSGRVKEFKAAMKSKDEAVRLKAVAEISATKHKDIAAALAKSLRDRSPKVKAAVARALGAQGDLKYCGKLQPPKKYDKMNPDVLLAYLEGLAGMPHRSSIDPLVKLIKKVMSRMKPDEQPIGVAATEALGKIKERAAVEELIKILGLTNPRAGSGDGAKAPSAETRRFRGAFKQPIVDGLADITAERFKDPLVWERWWKKNQKTWKVPTGEEDVNRSATYRNSGYNFRLKKPRDSWTFVPATGGNYVITLGHPQEGNPTTLDAYLKVEAYSTSAYAGANPSDRAAYFEQWARDTGFKDVKKSSTTDVKFAGESAKLWYAKGMASNGAIVTMQKYFFVHDSLLFTIHLQTLSGVPDQLKKDLEKATASFAFTK